MKTDRKPSGDYSLRAIAPGSWLYRGYFSNSGLFELEKSCVLIDTQVSPRAARFLKHDVAKKIGKPIDLVLITHHHGDHTGGLAEFQDAESWSQELTAKWMIDNEFHRKQYAATFGLVFQEEHPILPTTRTFTGDKKEFRIGDNEIEMRHIGSAETEDAHVIWWKNRAVVAVGDGVPTIDYPFMGTPFLDEGLRDDGKWIGFLETLLSWKPEVLLPGHGPALVGATRIAERLTLLRDLFADLIFHTKDGLNRGLDYQGVQEHVEKKMGHYRRHKDLREKTLSQRFAVYRCINSLTPERAGMGWWQDLRPSVLEPMELTDLSLDERARRSEQLFEAVQKIRPKVDGAEHLVECHKIAHEVLKHDPKHPVALLYAGAIEVIGGLVLCQNVSRPREWLIQALHSNRLNAKQKRIANFFVAKSYQLDQNEPDSDHYMRAVLPKPLRWSYPLLRAHMRSLP